MTTAAVRVLTLVGALMAALVVPASPASSTPAPAGARVELHRCDVTPRAVCGSIRRAWDTDEYARALTQCTAGCTTSAWCAASR